MKTKMFTTVVVAFLMGVIACGVTPSILEQAALPASPTPTPQSRPVEPGGQDMIVTLPSPVSSVTPTAVNPGPPAASRADDSDKATPEAQEEPPPQEPQQNIRANPTDEVSAPEPQQEPPPQEPQQNGSGNAIGFLSGPNAGDPLDIALDYIHQNKRSLGLTDDDLADIVVKDRYVTQHNQVTHIYLRQRLEGIEVFNGDININISGDGEVINLGNGFVSDLKDSVNVREPSLSAIEAVNRAAQHLGLTITEPLVPQEVIGGPAREVVLSDGGISQEDIPVKLMYQRQGRGQVRLAWDMVIGLRNADHWWDLRVDAVTGEVLAQNDLIVHDTYRVYALPLENPNDGPRTLEVDPADLSASPYAWHDTDGAAGPEYTITRGNNVHAYADRDGNNAPDPGGEPDGGPTLNFDFPIDLGQDPSTYIPAAVTNLFYWNNILHDIHYQYGYDEASGNFQVNNYGGGGAGGDDVRAEAQDGADLVPPNTNNANFYTPPDGARPRMQMYLWDLTTPWRDGDLSNGIIAHEYGHGVSNRLTGGPSNAGCLQNDEQMGEGWSDLHTLFLTAVASDAGPDARGIGTYVLGQPPTGAGIRNFRYSTDMGVNPQTYDSIKTTGGSPHALGEIWAAIVWEVYWNLVADYGFDADFYGGGGNNLTMQLVMDGMKLQPCSPGFVDGRDAILLADQINNGGANQCRIWEGFAKRGLDCSADQGSSSSRTDGTEAFDLPPECLETLKISKSADPSPAVAGEVLSYELVARNDTPGTLTGVTITDQVPEDTVYVPGSASHGGSESGGVVSFPPVTMNTGEVIARTFQVTVSPALVSTQFFFDDMESGDGNWTATGLWHLEDDGDACGNSHSPTTSWYYGQSLGCTYDTGAANSGQLTMAASVSLPASFDQVALTFWSWEQTEALSPWDSRQVFVSTDGTNFTQIWDSTNNDAAWYEVEIDLSSYIGQNVWIRFEFDTLDSIANNYTGWYVDDVEIISQASVSNTACVDAAEGDSACDTLVTPVEATSGPTGTLQGTVTDANTTNPIANAQVVADTYSTYTNGSGFYQFITLPVGSYDVTASADGYAPDTAIGVPVTDGGTTVQDFNLTAGLLSYTPDSLEVTLPINTTKDLILTLTNSGGLAAAFEFLELDQGMTPAGPFESPDYVVEPFEQGYQTTENLTLPDPSPAPPYAAGDVIQSWSSGLASAWGIAYDGDDDTAWVASPSPAWGGNNTIYEYTTAGAPTGRSHPFSWNPPYGPADAAFNQNTGMLWVMNVDDVNNCIYEIDPATGFTGNTICPGGGTGFSISQRGLAYDPTTDTYFAGSWNDSMIHHFAPDGTMLDEVNVGLAIAGLAYNPDTEHLFAIVNASPNPVYVLDAANNYALVGQFNISSGFGDYSGAGLEMDCDGNLWAVDQNTETVYQLESGESTTMCSVDVAWLSEDPVSGTVASLDSRPITIHFDASVPEVTGPGEYHAELKIVHDTPYDVANVPVTMIVTSGSGPSVFCDFDGDEDSDPGVFRPSNGKWYLRNIGSFYYGMNGDISVEKRPAYPGYPYSRVGDNTLVPGQGGTL
jgi:extracellular elastinolytic metalloproteinase